ncbi:MAG TPA: hypothetical protein GX506_08795 [Firmicutes bacterium]|nr:hypothetical protein [Bacillota bacterium]
MGTTYAPHVRVIGQDAYCVVCGNKIEPERTCRYGCCFHYACSCEGSRKFDKTQDKLAVIQLQHGIERLEKEMYTLQDRIKQRDRGSTNVA